MTRIIVRAAAVPTQPDGVKYHMRMQFNRRYPRFRTLCLAALLLAAPLALQGCLVAVAGAAGAGYVVGKDKRSVGTMADDSDITARIKTRYLTDGKVNVLDVAVSTYEGVVTLTGTVPSASMRNSAVELARNTKGVKSVVDKITVKPKS